MNFEIGKTIEQTSHFFQAPFSPKKVLNSTTQKDIHQKNPVAFLKVSDLDLAKSCRLLSTSCLRNEICAALRKHGIVILGWMIALSAAEIFRWNVSQNANFPSCNHDQ